MGGGWSLCMSTKQIYISLQIKNTIYLLLSLLCLVSCDKNNDLGESCNYEENPLGVDIQSNTVIPLHSRNFWVYTDSLWQEGIFEGEKSSLIKIEKVYDLDGRKSMKFSQIIPQLTLRNDTLYSTRLTPEPTFPNCYEILHPMFFSPTGIVQVDDDPFAKFVYRSSNPVETPVGTFSDNIVYEEEDTFEVIVNEEVGIIKMSFFVTYSNNQKNKKKDINTERF